MIDLQYLYSISLIIFHNQSYELYETTNIYGLSFPIILFH